MNLPPSNQDVIRHAIDRGEFVYHFQPKVSLQTGEITGAEALLRWRRADGGFLLPGEFLPTVEKSGMMSKVTIGMLERLVEDIARLRRLRPELQVGLNVSAADLIQPDLVRELARHVSSPRIGPGNVMVEITETALLDDNPTVRGHLLKLIEMGVEVAMDDFGTGYSSVDMLGRVPFSVLKLDHGVIRRMAGDAKNTHIVRASLIMARELSLRTVAEGIESEPIYTFLAAIGCHEGQGFWMSPAVPIDDFDALLASSRRWPSCTVGLLHDAMARHLSYRRKLMDLAYVLQRVDPAEHGRLPDLDLHHAAAHCRFHRFLDIDHGDRPTAQALDRDHRQMHQVGQKVIEAAATHADPDVLVGLMGQFLELSSKVDAGVARLAGSWLATTAEQAAANPKKQRRKNAKA